MKGGLGERIFKIPHFFIILSSKTLYSNMIPLSTIQKVQDEMKQLTDDSVLRR